MNQLLLWNGLFSLVLSLLLGVAAIYLGFTGFKAINRHLDEEFELRNNNIAVALVSGAFIISLGILMRQVLDPISETVLNLTFKFLQTGLTAAEVLSTLGIVAVQFLVSLVLALLTLTLGTRLYMRLNRQTDELQEIANNNIAVAIVVGAITVTLALLLGSGIETFLNATIPAPPVYNDNLPFG